MRLPIGRHRLSYLYRALNATGQPYPDARWENAKYFDASVDTGWSDDDTDSKMRVKFPEMDETKDPPEDFIVYCETRHGPIGDEELKRVSSIAYYPVHVKPIRTVAKAAVSGRTQRIELIERRAGDGPRQAGPRERRRNSSTRRTSRCSARSSRSRSTSSND